MGPDFSALLDGVAARVPDYSALVAVAARDRVAPPETYRVGERLRGSAGRKSSLDRIHVMSGDAEGEVESMGE